MPAHRESLVLYFRDSTTPLGGPVARSRDPAVERSAACARRFAESPEGTALGEPRWAEIFLEHAHLYHGADESLVTPEMVRDIVFELFPRHVTAPPAAASAIVAELRMFFVFLARERASCLPFACAHALDDGADESLARALADPNRFGVAKGAVMAGLDEGFDIHSVTGLEAWLAKVTARERPATRGCDDRARRKAQRRARRRNR